MSLTVRRARAEDRAPMLDLWERSVRATHLFLQEDDIGTLHPLVAKTLASDELEWWVAGSQEVPLIGFLGYAPDTIEALFVDPALRGQGAGTLLVAHAQSLATGALKVDVNEQNDAARRFYESLGFAVVGRSARDSAGRPFPLLHMRREATAAP